VSAGSLRTLAQAYRRFAEVDAAGTAPLYQHVAVALSGSGDALEAIGTAPPRRRHPTVILAALHHLALAGQAPALAAAYAAGDAEAAGAAAIDTLVRLSGPVAALAARRPVRADQGGRHAVLYPALAEAAHRAGAGAIGLIDVGRPAGLNLVVDRACISYGDGPTLGDPTSPLQLAASVVGDRPVPDRALPEVVARVVVDPDPVDLTDPEEARWLRACLWPGRPEQAARLDAELSAAAAAPPVRLRGDAVELLPDALARVPADALPVVITTWALSRLPPGRRPDFLRRLEESAGRTVAWVSVEGVGVAPAVPTLGDRHASGHSIIGLARLDRSGLRAEALGRCWSRGRLLSWLAGS
jgi:hypothetical protein